MEVVERFELPESMAKLEKVYKESRDVYFSTLTLLAEKGLGWCRDASSEEFKTLRPYRNQWNRFYRMTEPEQKASLMLAKSIADELRGRTLFQHMSILEEKMLKYDMEDEAAYKKAAISAFNIIEGRKKGYGENYPSDKAKRNFWTAILALCPDAIEDDTWIEGKELHFYRDSHDMEHGIVCKCVKDGEGYVVSET